MSSFVSPTAAEAQAQPQPVAQGTGWVVYSGLMLVLAGFLNLVDGLWALDVSDSPAISDEIEELLWYNDSLETWGWVYTIAGTVLLVVGIAVFFRSPWARWLGVAAASASMILNMMWVFVFPIPALIHVTLAALVVYGLTTYGAREPGEA